MRQRLDLVSGVLVLLIVLAGSAALDATRRRHVDAMLIQALHEEERFIYELSALAQRSVGDQTEPIAATSGRLVLFSEGVARLERNLRALQAGGTLHLNDGRTLQVSAAQGRWVERNLGSALDWLRAARIAGAEPESTAAIQETFRQRGHELRTLLGGLAASMESQVVNRAVRMSEWQLAMMVFGIGLFMLGVFLLRRLVTTPLHRMSDGIEAMRESGRLVKLPVLERNELGVVAEGFNALAQQVEEQKARLRDHVVELQRVNAEMDQLAHVKDDFLATVNHQLRTPLTSIVEGLELFRDSAAGPLTSDQMAMVQMMSRNGGRLVSLVDDILDLIMLRSGRRPLNRCATDLAPVLQRAKTMWQPMSSTRTVTVACDGLPQVYMDPQAVGEVLDHLLRNALRHAPEHSDVLLTAQVKDGGVEVVVTDRGPGMSPEQLKQLFVPFTHIQTPDSPGSEGNGLGLAFCRQVIERHRGTIRAASAQGRGMTIAFTLPVATPQFLLEEACTVSAETAALEAGQYALVLVVPGASPSAAELMDRAADVLRRNTHRNDLFIRMDDGTLAIVAVTDQPGLEAMLQRVQRVAADANLGVRFGAAQAPHQGTSAGQLLAAVRRSLAQAAAQPCVRMPQERRASHG